MNKAPTKRSTMRQITLTAAANAERPTPNFERRIQALCVSPHSAFGVGRWVFSSSVFLPPFFPSAFEHEHGLELRFVAQALRDLARGVAALRAAVHHHLFLGRPGGQKLREQFVPAIFVQQDRAGNMVTRKV